MATFKFRMLSPAGLVAETEVERVQIPAADGEIGILPQHARYVGLLGTGVATYVTESGPKKVVLSGGFVTFENNVLEVLADTIDTRESNAKESLKIEKSTLENSMSTLVVDSPDWDEATSKLKRLQAIEML